MWIFFYYVTLVTVQDIVSFGCRVPRCAVCRVCGFLSTQRVRPLPPRAIQGPSITGER